MGLFTPLIYTKYGFTKEPILQPGQKALDVGCGGRKLPGAIGIDINKNSNADIVHDLNVYPWPIDNNAFDLILSQHVLEHLDDISKAMNEIHRIAKNKARVVIQVPYFKSRDAFTDPSHKHFFTIRSEDFLINKNKFKKTGFWIGWPQKSKNPAKELFKVFIHKYPNFYEKYLSAFFPAQCLTWEFEVVK